MMMTTTQANTLVEHITLLDAQEVVAQPALRADPLPHHRAADGIGGGHAQAGKQRRQRRGQFHQRVDLDAGSAVGAHQIDVTPAHLRHAVGEVDGHGGKKHIRTTVSIFGAMPKPR